MRFTLTVVKHRGTLVFQSTGGRLLDLIGAEFFGWRGSAKLIRDGAEIGSLRIGGQNMSYDDLRGELGVVITGPNWQLDGARLKERDTLQCDIPEDWESPETLIDSCAGCSVKVISQPTSTRDAT